MSALGPFDVSAEQVERLSDAFTEFVNRLLSVETARAGLAGYKLKVTSDDNIADGGVDALLDNPKATKWLPDGKSAWQFKRGDLPPKKCREELQGATWAQDLVRDGAHYRLVLGTKLTAQKIERRREALVEEAKTLGVIGDGEEERIQVLDANSLANWASDLPPLAVAPFLHGPGSGVQPFDYWSSSRNHEFTWTSSPERGEAIDSLRRALLDPNNHEVRVHGDSGVGKTRLVMEALRADDLRPLVAYVPDEGSVSSHVLAHLVSDDRSGILVVDECPGRGHDKLTERIPKDSAVKLITIGPTDEYAVRSPVIALPAMPGQGIEEFLETNYPQLFIEARRFIAEHCSGNPRFAIVLASRIQELGEGRAAELIRQNDIKQFLRVLLPEGHHPFFLTSVLALAERVGWDRELRPQLEALARFAGVTPEEFEQLGQDLEARGVLVQQGRYRAVSPHPLAVVLAASAWRSHRTRIVDELLPQADRDLALAVFKRVADLGDYEPAQSVLRQLMASDGPFGTLESIEANELGEFLIQLAIIASEETARHLSQLIEAESLDGLRAQTQSRRDLVWALEKLVWHRNTFEVAADSLLRLALAENESYANNATGTWLGLFGAALPATAATPEQRLAYLRAHADSDEEAIRLLVVQACAGTMHHHEVAMVSGERQGGRLVEPRGSVRTLREAAEYRVELIRLLARLARDSDQQIAKEAVAGLVGAIDPLIDNPVVKEPLFEALLGLEPDDITRVRREVENLRHLYRGRDERPSVKAALDNLAEALPPADVLERLRVLLQMSPWDVERREYQEEISDLVSDTLETDQLDTVFEWLSEDDRLTSGWFLGHALAQHSSKLPDLLNQLALLADANLTALAGYLQGLVDEGDTAAFDDFLDSDRARDLDLRTVLALTVRGPLSDPAQQRVSRLLRELPVLEGVRLIFGWQRHIDVEGARQLIDEWSERLASQEDYNAVIDWISLWRPRDGDLPRELHDNVWSLLKRRRDYPNLSNERWDWGQLSALFASERPFELATVILDLISDDKGLFIEGDQEARLLCDTAREKPGEVWAEVTNRLENGDWRIAMTLQGWFTLCVPIEIISEWVGDSVERGRLVASIASVGAAEPSAVCRTLLEQFGDDEKVGSSLAAEFMSGSWTGSESSRLSSQISQLEGWLKADLPPPVKQWATRMIQSLERSREAALEREAERGY